MQAALRRFGLVALLASTHGSGLVAQDMTQQIALQQAQIAQQQAQIAQQQAQMLAQQQAQTANQQAQQAGTQANQQSTLSLAREPKFSMRAGSYPGPITLKINAPSRGSVIYYTTDGWTPTESSNLYTGPLQLTRTTTLQAIAVSPFYARSFIRSAVYNLPAATSVAPVTEPSLSDASPSLLHKGTAVPLIFATTVTSKEVKVGDRLPVVLADDLRAGGIIVAPKGTPAVVSVFQADKAAILGLPGVIQFKVESVRMANGARLPLKGFEKKEGASTLFVRGGEAVIERGATLTAVVAADTPVTANQANADNDANVAPAASQP